MIDPRILQQHFRKVQEREMPPKPEIPRIPDPEPLTAVQAIPIPEPVIEQKVELPPAPKLKIEEKELINLIINTSTPLDSLIIDEVEDIEEKIELEQKEESVYDPYGYYSKAEF
jgi:hypothetical protein